MPDVLGPLRKLGAAPLTDRETVDVLRRRTARRLRRRRVVLAPVLVMALVGMGALAAAVRDDGPPHAVDTVDDRDGPPTSTPTSTSTMVPSAPAGAPNPLAGVRRVVSGAAGVVVLDPVANPPARRLTDEPTILAFGVGDGLVVSQHGDLESGSPGPIVIFEGSGERELLEAPATGLWLELLDARIVGGRPLALVATASGIDPETHEVRLSKLDLETGDRTDLGVVGGWEEGVAAGHLLSDGDVVFQRSWISGGNLERRSPSGGVVWTSDALGADGEDRIRTMVVHDAALLVLETLEGNRFEVRRFDLATGGEGSPTEVTVFGDEEIGAIDGVCGKVHSAPGGLLCSRSYEGGPVLVDLSSGRATALPDAAPERGSAMTVWRDPPSR